MRSLFIFLILILCRLTVHGQQEPASYARVIGIFKQFYNSNKPDSIYKIAGPELRKSLSEAEFRNTNAQLKTQLGNLNTVTFTSFTDPVATYSAVFQKGNIGLQLSLNKENQIIGLRLQPVQSAINTAQPANTANDFATETLVSEKTLAGTISGTLSVPIKAEGKIPVVLIIAGSGTVDRNGNSLPGLNTNTYLLLATELAKNGIASLRYDKRNTGQSVSPTKEKEMRFENNSDDAVALINMLHDDARFSKIIILGHSEGALVGMLAAVDQPVNALISVAGAGSRIDEVMTEQTKSMPDYLRKEFTTILDSLKKGKITDKVDPAIYSLARPSVQPYLLSWMRHEPAKEIKKLKIPVLIIQGTTDLQVNVNEATKLKKAKSDAVLNIIPNMNHILKDAPVDRDANLATYTQPNLPLNQEMLTDIIAFINKLK